MQAAAISSLVAISVLFISTSVRASPLKNKEVYDNNTLVFLHVLFRHGDRTVDTKAVYPLDPYFNSTYYPVGRGELTKEGKRREFLIGDALRRSYGKFLGTQYTPDILEATSTAYSRTKASMQLVLAALYPPTSNDVFINDLNWQPIPFNYTPEHTNTILSDAHIHCKKYKQLYKEYLNSTQGAAVLAKYTSLFQYLTSKTGVQMKTPEDVYELFFTLKSEQDWGYKLPSWTNSLWPAKITKLAAEEYLIRTATSEMRKYGGGYLLQKIINDTISKAEGKINDRKIALYSAHEYNVVYLLRILGAYRPHVPPFGSYIVFEVHNINGTYMFKVSYQDYSSENPVPIVLENCNLFCPVDKFQDLVKDNLPKPTDNCEND